MVGHHRDLEDVFDTTLAKLVSKHSPEFNSVIGANSYAQDQSGEGRKGSAEIAWCSLAKGESGTAAIGVGFCSLRGIALVKSFGFVRFGDDASPVGNHFFVRLGET